MFCQCFFFFFCMFVVFRIVFSFSLIYERLFMARFLELWNIVETHIHLQNAWNIAAAHVELQSSVFKIPHWCLKKNTPPDKKTRGKSSFKTTKSGAGEEFLLLWCKATTRVKGVFFHRHWYGVHPRSGTGHYYHYYY